VFVTGSLDERSRLIALLGNGVPVLVKTPPERGIGNLYLGVESWTIARPSRLAVHPDRRFSVRTVQVARPDPDLFVPQAPVLYSVVKSEFATYAELKAERASYDALAYSYTAAAPSPYPPWPPSDV
jgi:hypothetical protein